MSWRTVFKKTAQIVPAYLINVIFTRKVRLPKDKFGEDAANAPHIDRLGIFMASQHDFRGTVPSGDDIFREKHGTATIAVLVGVDATRQAKVANFEIGIRVHQQVGWLQVAVDDFGGVDVPQTSDNLVHEVPHVVN